MIIKLSCQAIIDGEKFYPEILSIPDKIRVIEKQTVGDEVSFGRFKGDLSSEGILIIDGDIEEVLQFINFEILSKFSREQVQMNLCILANFEGDCNFELNVDHIEKISLLKIPLSISCYSR